MKDTKFKTIDDYISAFPAPVQEMLHAVRETIQQAVPEADETISYDMPTFVLNGRKFLYFAGWKNHIALYPVTADIRSSLKEEAAAYKGTKDSIHFPLKDPMPLELIEKIVALRLKAHAAERKG